MATLRLNQAWIDALKAHKSAYDVRDRDLKVLGVFVSGVAIASAASLGGADVGPARRFVERAGEAHGLDEHWDRVAALGEFVGQLPEHERDDVRAQVARVQVADPERPQSHYLMQNDEPAPKARRRGDVAR